MKIGILIVQKSQQIKRSWLRSCFSEFIMSVGQILRITLKSSVEWQIGCRIFSKKKTSKNSFTLPFLKDLIIVFLSFSFKTSTENNKKKVQSQKASKNLKASMLPLFSRVIAGNFDVKLKSNESYRIFRILQN